MQVSLAYAKIGDFTADWGVLGETRVSLVIETVTTEIDQVQRSERFITLGAASTNVVADFSRNTLETLDAQLVVSHCERTFLKEAAQTAHRKQFVDAINFITNKIVLGHDMEVESRGKCFDILKKAKDLIKHALLLLHVILCQT